MQSDKIAQGSCSVFRFPQDSCSVSALPAPGGSYSPVTEPQQERAHAPEVSILDTTTVLYRDYAHLYCMLQSSYRWDGLNFENSSLSRN